TTNPNCRLLLQVHDELVFEIAADEVETFVPKIVKIMSEIYKLKVSLMVEAKVGDNWKEMKRMNQEL
ncbi:MAG: DNA polymerase, partial [bacterium]|nr:DNA polymerase [bacterium]